MRRFLALAAFAALLLSCKGGLEPTYPPVGGGEEALTKWLELPETSPVDGLDFFFHDCDIDGKKVRNYSFYWDYTNLVSHWVAYPLCGMYLGSSGRSETWGYDPNLPASKQQNVSGGYKEGDNGWYTRGHQIRKTRLRQLVVAITA